MTINDSTTTVSRYNTWTWLNYHLAHLNEYLAVARANNKWFALTEWGTVFSAPNPPQDWHPVAQDPWYFIYQTKQWLAANRADIAWDQYFSSGGFTTYGSWAAGSVQDEAADFYRTPSGVADTGGWD